MEACLADRAKVKEKLVELLPKFKRKINRSGNLGVFTLVPVLCYVQVYLKEKSLRELEEKNKTLSENPGLLQLYKVHSTHLKWGVKNIENLKQFESTLLYGFAQLSIFGGSGDSYWFFLSLKSEFFVY